MVPERDLDPTELYRAERRRLVALLEAASADELAQPVSATPAWRVRDVLAHVVGIAADLNAQRFPATPEEAEAWTAAQVAVRRDRPIEELGREWEHEGPTFEAGLRLFGYEWGAHYLGDLLQHVGDVHHALGRPPARDDRALAVALDFYLASLDEALVAEDVGPVLVLAHGAWHDDQVAADEVFSLGPADPDGGPRAVVAGHRWELFRALGGRRTQAEVDALDWSGPAWAEAAARFSRYPLPTASLHESRRGHPDV